VEHAPGVVLEDPAFVVIDKPSGMHTAPLRKGEEGTLLAWALARYPEIAAVPGRKPIEPGLLHRLDLETSGLVLLARTAPAWDALIAASRGGCFLKHYEALVSRVDTPPPGTRRLLPPAGADPWPPLPLVIESGFRAFGPGRRLVGVVEPAAGVRLYRTRLLALEPRDPPPTFRALVELDTGFRHQVRVHLAAIGLSILGDALYGPPGSSAEAPPSPRLCLNACALEFPHPETGRPVVVTLPAF
jgi:23S rRNA pseudouridine1911/1915/1917 synthase